MITRVHHDPSSDSKQAGRADGRRWCVSLHRASRNLPVQLCRPLERKGSAFPWSFLHLQPAARAGECGPGWSAFCGTLGTLLRGKEPAERAKGSPANIVRLSPASRARCSHGVPRVPQNTLHAGPRSLASFAGPWSFYIFSPRSGRESVAQGGTFFAEPWEQCEGKRSPQSGRKAVSQLPARLPPASRALFSLTVFLGFRKKRSTLGHTRAPAFAGFALASCLPIACAVGYRYAAGYAGCKCRNSRERRSLSLEFLHFHRASAKRGVQPA